MGDVQESSAKDLNELVWGDAHPLWMHVARGGAVRAKCGPPVMDVVAVLDISSGVRRINGRMSDYLDVWSESGISETDRPNIVVTPQGPLRKLTQWSVKLVGDIVAW